MSVKVKGMKRVISELESRLNEVARGSVTDAALIAGSKAFEKELRSQLKTFKDTGATLDEIQVMPPETIDGVRTVRVRWRGPENRYRIIHLNEWGTIKNPNPRGKGKIAVALRNSEKDYRDAVKNIIKAAL